ncbi:MAG: PD-(D/E)XK nuclease family protein [Pelolinea sp.]|nr:PD-(D/E)XK nuclease family protein [Pelolinea sp.]
MGKNTEAYRQISEVLAHSQGDADVFVDILRKEKIQHLSFSQITTVEFCEYRYHLQYIEMRELEPTPTYFAKGKAMHELIADTYRGMQNGNGNEAFSPNERISDKMDAEGERHLMNAYRVHREHMWMGYEIEAVEHPFVMEIEAGLLPMVGVIDLVLRQNGDFTLVDHKTGRDFYPYDVLQVAIYAKHIEGAHAGKSCRLFYDHYRWVNNLERIRKPAFQRTEVNAELSDWGEYLERIREGAVKIERLREGGTPTQNGKCFMCPYRGMCWG